MPAVSSHVVTDACNRGSNAIDTLSVIASLIYRYLDNKLNICLCIALMSFIK